MSDVDAEYHIHSTASPDQIVSEGLKAKPSRGNYRGPGGTLDRSLEEIARDASIRATTYSGRGGADMAKMAYRGDEFLNLSKSLEGGTPKLAKSTVIMKLPKGKTLGDVLEPIPGVDPSTLRRGDQALRVPPEYVVGVFNRTDGTLTIFKNKVDGGSVTELFPQRNTLERAAKIGYDVPDWLKGASGSELLDRPVGVPKDFNDPGFIRMIENPALGYDSDYLYQLNQYVTTRRNVLKRDYDEELRKAFEDYPDNINVGNIDNADKIKLQLEQFRGYDESANSMSGQYLIRFARKVDGVQVDLTPIESSVGLSTQIVNFANKLEGSLLDDLTTPEFMRNPVLQNIKLGFDAVVKEFPEGSRREGFRALEAMFDDYQDLDKARELMPVGFSDDHNKKRFLNKFMNDYFKLDAPKKK